MCALRAALFRLEGASHTTMNDAETRAEHIDPALKAAAQLSPGAGYGSICP